MPNHVVIASGAVVAVSVAVATAIAIYESPEVRRYAEDVRRRIALAINNIGDGLEPSFRQPRFNRPEDADGFLESSQQATDADIGVVDADEESRRRQREELMYWNSIHDEKQTKVNEELAAKLKARSSGKSFDDFLQQDEDAERGTFVFNSGADARDGSQGLRNRTDGARGFSSLYANPFADENQIDSRELDGMTNSQAAPLRDELSDIYSATTRDENEKLASDIMVPTALIGTVIQPVPAPVQRPLALLDPVSSSPSTMSSATLERELGPDEFVTAGQDDHDEAYASIQAWAQNSSQNFYSPLPTTPADTVSEPELLSDGQLTPTDSVSIIGSTEHLGNDAHSVQEGGASRDYDVMSESEGMLTPASWSEVGSVISESDAHIPTRP